MSCGRRCNWRRKSPTPTTRIRQQTSHLMNFAEVRTDPLTGVHNRRGLDDALTSHLALTSHYGTVFSLVIFDIDHFKQVNDRDGHLHGDHVLQELARLFDERVRETDIVGRYGGEEFIVIMPHTDLTGACCFAERLRREVAAASLGITVSGGLAAAQDRRHGGFTHRAGQRRPVRGQDRRTQPALLSQRRRTATDRGRRTAGGRDVNATSRRGGTSLIAAKGVVSPAATPFAAPQGRATQK